VIVSQAVNHVLHRLVEVVIGQAVFYALADLLSYSLPIGAVEIGVKIGL
jgi:hypothetical protein